MYNDHTPITINTTHNHKAVKIIAVVVAVLLVAAVAGYFISMVLAHQLETNAVKDELITQNQRLKAGKENDRLSDASIASILSTDRANVVLAVSPDKRTYCIEAVSVDASKNIAFHMDGDTPELEPQAGMCGENAKNTPPKVAGLTVASNAAGAITLGWDTVPDAFNYRIECSLSDTFATIASFAEVSDSKGSVANLKENGTYYCRVAAKNSKGQGGWSDAIKASTAQTLSWPQGLEVKAQSTSSISYTWKPVEGATRYVFQYAKDVNFTEDLVTIPTTGTSGTLANLTKFTVYYFHVKAITPTVTEVQAPFSPAVQGRTDE